MVSTDRKFIFIHIPKTGGNSIQARLIENADDEIVTVAPHQDGIERFELRHEQIPSTKHSTLSEYENWLGLEAISSMYKFTCTRNPWDRAISFFFSPHRGHVRWERDKFLDFIRTVPTSEKYLQCSLSGDEPFSAMDFLIRFDALQEDFNQLCDNLRIQRKCLPHANKSRKNQYREYYDEELIEVVAQQFKLEIDYFGYRF